MALDPNIPLQVKPLTFDFAQSTAEALKLKHLLAQDKLNTAFVFDTGPDGNPVMNRPKTLANLYRADPQSAMAYEQKLALQDHWAGQKAYQQRMLQGAEEGRRIKAFNAITSRMRSDLAGLYSDYSMLPPEQQADPKVLQDYTQRQEGIFQNYRQNGMPLEDLRSKGMIPQTFDPNAIRSAITDPNSFQKVAQEWYQRNPEIGMTDTGEQVSIPDSPEYNAGDLQQNDPQTEQSPADPTQPDQGGFVQTGVPRGLPSLAGKFGAQPKANAAQQKKIRVAELLSRANQKNDAGQYILSPEQRDDLVSSAYWLDAYDKKWSPSETFKIDAKTGKKVLNPLWLEELTVKKNAQKEVAKEGRTVVYPPGTIKPTAPTENKNQEAMLNAAARMSRLTQIRAAFRPEWLQIGARLGQSWNAIKDKMGMDLDQKDQADLKALTDFKTKSLADLNSYIKELSGATVTHQEADRIFAQLPNPGTNPFNGDSSHEFITKLDAAMQQVRIAEAKGVYMARNGLTLSDGPAIERMPQIMLNYMEKAKAQLAKSNPKIPADELTGLGKKAVSEYFGIPLDAPVVAIPPKGKK